MNLFRKLTAFVCSAALILVTVPMGIAVFAEEKSTLLLDGAVETGYENDWYALPNGVGFWNAINWKEGTESLLKDSTVTMNTYSDDGTASPGTWTDPDTGTVYPNLAAKGEYGVTENGNLKFTELGCGAGNQFWVDAWGDGSTMDLIFQLKNYSDLSAFSLINRTEKVHQAAYYELYAAHDKADLFKADSKVATYDRTDQVGKTEEELDNRLVNLFSFNNLTDIGYFAIRLKYVEPSKGFSPTQLSFRAMNILLCGNKSGTAVPNSHVTEDNMLEIPTDDLLHSQDVFSNATMFSPENLEDGSITSDSNISRVFAAWENDTARYIDDGSIFVTVGYDLGKPAEVSKFAVYNHISLPLRTYRYELYAANDKGGLFNEENRVEAYVNALGTRRQIFNVEDKGITARYVGLKVLFPCFDKGERFDLTKVTAEQNNIYTRLSEFRIYGTLSDLPDDPVYSITNDFEHVYGYNNSSFVIEDTGDAEHGKALATVRCGAGAWRGLEGTSLGTYTSAEGKTMHLFNESVKKDADYILSYDYRLVDPSDCKNGQLFSVALKQEQWKIYPDNDYRNYAKNYNDTDWHKKTVGFTSETDTAPAKLLIIGADAKCYIDNYTLSEAVSLNVDGARSAVHIVDHADNILFEEENLNQKMLLPKGDTASFSLEVVSGAKITSVKAGNTELTPDENGVYTVDELLDNITVTVKVDDTSLKNAFTVSDDTIYVPAGSTALSIADKAKIAEYIISLNKPKDQPLIIGDTLNFSLGSEPEFTLKVKFLGDLNGDGKITVTDITEMISCLLSGETPNTEAFVYDLNKDSRLSVTDLINLRRDILNSTDLGIADAALLSDMEQYINEKIEATGLKELSTENLQNGLVFPDADRTRIANLLRKAMRKEDITIATLGGSVTEGACSFNKPKNLATTLPTQNASYPVLLKNWLSNTFGCKVTLINAGISATDSVLGLHRVDEDVLAYDPDLTIVEYAVNDDAGFTYKGATYEALVRKLLSDDTAVILLEMCCPPSNNNCASSQKLHEPVGDHYKVPMISYRNAFMSLPEFQECADDVVHPNVVGHTLLSLDVIHYLGAVYEDINTVGAVGYNLPSDVYYSDAAYYTGAYMADFEDIIDGKVEGVRITDMGSFVKDTQKSDFVQHNDKMACNIDRSYYGVSATYSENYKPMVLEIDRCKSLFTLMLRAGTSKIVNGRYKVEINGEMIENDTLTCSLSDTKDNSQLESWYHWASANLYKSKTPQKLTVKIYPTGKDPMSKVTLYSLLLS